jgi:hypothetical protein
MAEETLVWRKPRFWIWLVAIVILLLFAYFYRPLESYIVENVPKTRFASVIFWFVSAVAVIAYGISHWQSFRRNILGAGGVQVDALAFDSLQVTLMTAVILCAGATLQAVERLSEYVMSHGNDGAAAGTAIETALGAAAATSTATSSVVAAVVSTATATAAAPGGSLGERLLVIVLFLILTILFYLLHLLVRAFRVGWQPRRTHPGTADSSGPAGRRFPS